MFADMVTEYPVLLLKSIGNYTFEALGRIAKKSGDTIARLLQPAPISYGILEHIAQATFAEKGHLCLIIDTLL